MFKYTLSIVASATLVASLGAQTLTLEPIVITSNAINIDELRAPYAAEIYTTDEIAKSHAKNIYDFFNQETSLTASQGYGNPFAQQLDVHGYGLGDAGYQNIVITLNGRRLNNIDLVPQLLGSIPINTIERIEILKGAGSVTYGDGASAAVINIITKQGNSNELAFYAGNYHTLGQSLYLSQAKDRYSYALHLDHFNTNGTRVVDTNDNRDAQKSTNGGIELSYKPTDTLELHGGASFTRNNSIYASSMNLDEYNADPAQLGSAGYSSHQIYNSNTVNLGSVYILNNNYSIAIDASQEHKQSDYADPYYTSTTNYTYKQLDAHLDYKSDSVSSVFGTQIFWGKRNGSSGTTSKNNEALYLSTQLHVNNHTFTAGGRYEKVAYQYEASATNLSQDNTLYGTELGYNYQLSPKSSLFTSYSHAYQAPDIDRFFAYDFGTSTYTFNGFIEPMKSDTYTIGYNLIDSNNKFKASIFYVNLSNEIYLFTNTYSNTNLDKSHKYGLDLYDKWLINDQFNIVANYNYVQAVIDKEHQGTANYDGNDLPAVSNHNIKATISYLPNTNTTLAITQLYKSEAFAQEDFNNNFSQKQDAYKSTNVSITYTKDNYEMFAKITNLFDQANGIWIRNDAIYPVDFTTTFTAGLKFIF